MVVVYVMGAISGEVFAKFCGSESSDKSGS